jgi:hypothetical protein
MMRTLKVSLVASGIGILAWLSGLTTVIWPAHPQFAAFVFTVIATVALFAAWPNPHK